jgi:hypothetical protein
MGTKGQSEPAAINAPAGRFVHGMGCVFSFGAGCDLSQSILFYFLVLDCFFFEPDLTHNYLTPLPILISAALTFIPIYYPLLITVFSIVFLFLIIFSLNLTSHILPYTPSYSHKCCTNLDTSFIIPY